MTRQVREKGNAKTLQGRRKDDANTKNIRGKYDEKLCKDDANIMQRRRKYDAKTMQIL